MLTSLINSCGKVHGVNLPYYIMISETTRPTKVRILIGKDKLIFHHTVSPVTIKLKISNSTSYNILILYLEH